MNIIRILKNKLVLICILVFIHTTFWFILKPVSPGSDDKIYKEYAISLIHGNYHLHEGPKNHRVIVFAPAAVFIALLGDNPFVISLWPLLCSLITIIYLFLFLSKYSSLVIAFTASFFMSCNNLQITYSAALFPDVIVALFAFLFIAKIYAARIRDIHETQNAIVATLFFLTGFLAKEIILIVLPFSILVFIHDWKNKSHLRFWKNLFLMMFSGAVLLNAVYFFITDDINFIYHCINKNHNEVFALFSYSELIKRYTYQPLIFLFNCLGYSILILFFLCFLITRKSLMNNSNTNSGDIHSISLFFLIYFIILLITYWWGTTSFNHLSPILLFNFERMWMILLIPLSIIAAITVVKVTEEKNSKSLIILSLIFIMATLVSWIFISPNRAFYFFIFAISSIISIIFKEKTTLSKKITVAFFLIPLFIDALYFTLKNSNWMLLK